MSNPYTGVVVSALRKCQLMLQPLDQIEAEHNPLLLSALHEGALLHLWRAYQAFLAEQGYELRLGFSPGGEPESAQALAKMATACDKLSAEVGELVNLEENPDSWFHAMACTWRGLWHPAGNGGDAESGSGSVQTLIPVRQLDRTTSGGPVVLDREQLQLWHQALTELVLRQRAQSQEW